MRIAYLDCFSGISGDMFLGALVDAGVPARLLEETVAGLNVGARLEISRVMRSGISATKVDVYVNGEKDMPREEYAVRQRQHEHAHARHEHSHDHPQQPVQLLEHNYAKTDTRASAEHTNGHSRGLKEIREVINTSSITPTAKKTAIEIFELLGAAEAKIHNSDVESVHFHETGAVDAIVDVVCATVGSEALGVDEIVCSPLNTGGGTVECMHGTFPVPAPATLELLKNAPIYSSGLEAELVTPTGAAIVGKLVNRFADLPLIRVERIGYGAGSREFSGHANVVRLTVGEAQATREEKRETITVLEANLDDLNPQVFGYVMGKLMDEGALDAYAMPVQMKKNRPGMMLSVLCRAENAGKLTELIFRETTTLGVRRREEMRETLDRKWVTVTTQWGEVRIKVASLDGVVTNYVPEYEDCRRIASEQQVALKTVMQEAVRKYLERT